MESDWPRRSKCHYVTENDFCDVGILSQSQLSSSSPRTTVRGIRCEEHSSFILSWNLIGQGETKVITSQKSFPGLGSRTLFLAETRNSRKYVYIRRLTLSSQSIHLGALEENILMKKNALFPFSGSVSEGLSNPVY